MKKVLLPQPMVAKVVTVIGGNHDQGVFEEAAVVQETEQNTELVVDLLDQTHVSGNDRGTDFIAREGLADRQIHEFAIDRMRIGTLIGRANGGKYIVRRVKGMVGS